MYQEDSRIFAKTKILATLGPATSSIETIRQLMDAGIDGVRLNFSHGDYEFYEKIFSTIHETRVKQNAPLGVLLDLQGPKIRIGELEEPSFEIKNGDYLEITTEKMKGTREKVSTSYTPLPQDAQIGDIILIDDGLLKLKIESKTPNSVRCLIINGGILKPKKGMNLPGMKLSTPAMTEKDLRDLEFAIKFKIDFVALSFVRDAKDISDLRNWLRSKNSDLPIIAKIEKPEAVANFEEILAASDGIMVARGDLGVEMEPQDVPVVQKMIIRRCNEAGKMVITATQMLESMISNPVPTRAEASDVANAVWDGTDVVMLSGETSVGKFPVRAVEIMNNILKKAETDGPPLRKVDYDIPESVESNVFDAVNRSIVQVSEQIHAAAIVVFTHHGRTARSLSKFKPKARIIAVSDSFETMNNLCLKWGVTSIFSSDIKKESAAIETAKRLLLESGHVKKGDLVIFTAAAPYSEKSRLNWMKFETME
ncbi:MAG: pyruvate kinase [Ignavibacteriales bacterium]|nr:Pyruvate kinase [Ignavibacteriaceae bacterium]QOJ27777.1 MAG: pyruvate kinase [Ignavibacteriales bacterium]